MVTEDGAGRNPRFPSREECVLGEVIAQRAEELQDKTYALFEDGSSWSYARTAEEAWRCAQGFRREGVRIQECVSFWMPTGPDLLRSWFGAVAAGAIYAPLNLAARGTYLEHQLNVAESRFLVAHSG